MQYGPIVFFCDKSKIFVQITLINNRITAVYLRTSYKFHLHHYTNTCSDFFMYGYNSDIGSLKQLILPHLILLSRRNTTVIHYKIVHINFLLLGSLAAIFDLTPFRYLDMDFFPAIMYIP